MILLDTSYLILLAKGSNRVVKVIEMIDSEGPALTSISYFEIFRSYKKMSKREIRYFSQLFSTYPVLPLDTKAAEEASQIWSSLERIEKPVNVLDVLIAGIMIANGIEKIVTSDKDFLEIAKVSDIEVILV